MAVDVTLNDITSGYNLSKINENFQRIDTALQDAVSRTGGSPNQMVADLDMNNYDVLNVGLLQANDIRINGSDPDGLITRIEEAVASTEADVVLTHQDVIDAAASVVEASDYADFARNNWVVNTFVGDGVTTAFALTVDPGNKNNTFVTMDGVAQARAGYSVLGTTLTFTEAPPSGVAGEISTSNSVPTTTVADLSVTSLKLADGAVTNAKLATNAVSTIKILDSNVTTAKLADANVTTVKIADVNVTTAKIADDAITFGKMQNINTSNFIGRVSTFTGDPELIPFTTAGLTILQGATVAAQVASLGLTPISFSANKNGTSQTGIAVNTSTKLTFTTEVWDIGSFYDAVNSKFVPPAGKYRISAGTHVVTPTDGYRMQLTISKNGTPYKTNYVTSAATSNSSVTVTGLVDANGTDYFEIFLQVLGATGTFNSDGPISETWFDGEVV